MKTVQLSRACSALFCIVALISVACLGIAVSSAWAVSPQDQHDIAALRSIFGVDASQASDEQLAQLLDAPKLGPSIRGDVTCAFVGQHALDGTGAERVEVEAMLNEFASIVAADQFVNPLITGAFGESFGAEFVVELHGDLGTLHSALSTFVSAEAYLDSDGAYRSWLSQYYGDETEGGLTAAEARQDVEETAGSALVAVTQPRGMSRPQLFSQFEYSSNCMRLVQEPDVRSWYANYIDGIVEAVGEYEDGIGLTLVPVGSDYFEAVNSGDGMLTDVSVSDSTGGKLGEISELDAGQHEILPLSAGGFDASAATVGFSVDGVPGLETDYANVEDDLYVGNATAVLAAAPPSTAEFDIDPGPFAALGSSPTYSWSFGEGTDPTTGVHVIHSFSCYGEHKAMFTASSPPRTVTKTASIYVPPPFSLDWTTSTGEYAVAPGVPLTFQASSPIPTGYQVSWSFGDGQGATGPTVTHTFQSAAIENVTMSVTTPGCPALNESHLVTVGRSNEWVPLSGTIGTRTLRSSVAGYVINGPVTIPQGQTVTVEPGTNVKFASAAGERGQLLVNGTLDVAGAPGAPAVFTSRSDDSAGGHCSCAPLGSAPQPGDWFGITLLNGGVANVDHAEVRYANHDLDLQASSATLALTNSVLSDAGIGLYSGGPNTVTTTSSATARDSIGMQLECSCSNTPKVSDIAFDEEGIGIYAKGGTAAQVDGASFEGVKADVVLESTATRTTVSHTKSAGIGGFVEVQEGSLPTGVVRLDSDLPYAFFGRITVPTAGQLAVGPGTVVKFLNTGGGVGGANGGQLFVRGGLVASGTPSAPIYLTSPYDDSAGGHCGCVKSGIAPGSDWFGIQLASGASTTLDYAHVRYAGADLEVGSGAAAQIDNTELSNADTGLQASGPSTVVVANSSASGDGTGMQLNCASCSYTARVTNTTFAADSTGVGLTGNASAAIHGSSFGVEDHWGVFNGGNAGVDATGNWWGAPSGPRPTGSGALIVGNVAFQPFCTGATGCTSVGLTAGRSTIEANGRATTTITATLSRPAGPLAGEHVYFTSSDPGETIGPVADNGDGTYTATLTGSREVGAATVTATDASLNPPVSGSLTLTQAPPTVSLSVSPASLAADGNAVATATATVTGPSGPLSGDALALTSSDPGETIGPVADNGDGTYTATIKASKTVGTATITATDESADPGVSATAELAQAAAAEIGIGLSPPTILANGSATTTVTVSVSAGESPLSGQSVTVTSSDPGETIGPVADNGDGTYTATIKASKTVGVATITASDVSLGPAVTASATLRQVTPRQVQVALSPKSITAAGPVSALAMVKVISRSKPLSGDALALTSSDPGETIGPVADNGDGTYTATIKASKTVGTATITATDVSEGLDVSAAAALKQVAPKVAITLGQASIAANGRALTALTVRVTGADAQEIQLTSSDPGETIGPVADNGDGTYTATIKASKTVGTATITATDQSVSPSISKTAQLKQVAPTVSLSLAPTSIAANGSSTAIATAKVTAAGKPLSGDALALTSSDPGETIGPVADNGDGTYTATIKASKTVGTATITATDQSVSPSISKTAQLKQVAPTVSLSLAPTSIAANGSSTAIATAKVTAAGKPLSGDALALTSSDPGETIGPVADNGDGTYTATIKASKTVGTATITATDQSVSPSISKTAQLKQK